MLKLHHPDRHSSSEINTKRATEKTIRLNASYTRIREWREKGRL
jgi:hypothetical protein